MVNKYLSESNNFNKQVLIIGGGIAGISAALDLAEQGQYVYLVEKTPSIGGKMAQLDKTFPTLDCSICILAPKMVECARHPRIKLLTYSEVKQVIPIHDGAAFKVKILKKARYIDETKCTSCGDCAAICPVMEVPNQFDVNLKNNHAAFIPFLQAVPSKYVIDEKKCLYLNYKICKLCALNCKAKAIDFTQEPIDIEIEVASVIVAIGFDLMDITALKRYGYGKYSNVVTSLEYERIMCASGPTKGDILRLSDKKHPHKIALILCVGSRNVGLKPYCSKLCCMYATKEAVMTMEHNPNAEILIFYNDIRTIGKNHNEFIEKAKLSYHVKYTKGLPNKIYEDPKTKDLVLRYTDIASGEVKFETVNMVVLFPAIIPNKGAKELSEILGVETDEYGFIKPESSINNLETSIPGIYVCGCAHGPEDISTSVAEASGAACKAANRTSVIKAEEIKEDIIEKKVSKNDPPRIGVFICHCGSNIAGVVNVEKLAEEIKNVSNVSYVERNLYTCSEESQNNIVAAIKKYDLNRVIIAACTPRTHLPLFQNTCRKAGINPYLVLFASTRELVSWVHMSEPEKATEKAKEQILMSIANSRFVEPLYDIEVNILPVTLVIGGGIAGMTSSLAIANKGFKVYLVEQEEKLGGLIQNLNKINIEGISSEDILIPMIQAINTNPNIEVLTSTTVKEVHGAIGNFQIIMAQNGKEIEKKVGTIIVAVGGQEFKPNGYFHYNENRNIFTNLEFEDLIQNKKLKENESIAFIQCVGSREQQGRTYCSLICCANSIKNALKVKDRYPNSQVFILYRDIRVFYDEEIQYRKARERGINFIQYNIENPPLLNEIDEKLVLKVFDSFIGTEFELSLDKVILATPLIAWENSKRLSEILKVPLDNNGFFLEAHTKLRPVDFATDGVFLCGTAQSPKNIKETVSQALGAASRALILLMKGKAVVEGITSNINEEKCIGCGRCADICPYNAIELIEINNNMGIYANIKTTKAQVIKVLCKGCGACVGECPVGAIDQNHYNKHQIRKMIDILVGIE
jgi:heterodisulfide reductase subunit A